MTSAAFTRELLSQQTAEAVLVLLDLTHASLGAPIRITSDAVETVRGGQTYLPYAFDVVLPSEASGGAGRPQLVIDNVDRLIISAMRQIPPGDPVTVSAVVVLGSSPDTTERGPYVFALRRVTYNAFRITGELSYDDRLEDGYPAGLYTPSTFPGIFS